MGRLEGSAGIRFHKEKHLIGSKGLDNYFFAKRDKTSLQGEERVIE
jgi:hypothetical protein